MHEGLFNGIGICHKCASIKTLGPPIALQAIIGLASVAGMNRYAQLRTHLHETRQQRLERGLLQGEAAIE